MVKASRIKTMHESPASFSPSQGPGQTRTALWVGLCLWLALTSLFAIQGVVTNSEPLTVAITRAWGFWQLWLLFFPAIVWLSIRFPLARPDLLNQTAVHFLACVLIVIGSQIIYRTIIILPLPSGVIDSSLPKTVLPGMRAVPDIMIYLVVMSGCVAFIHSQRAHERERRAIELEARLAEAKLQALQMQINPHFLFNTLNAISTLTHTNPDMADDMITDLADLFRATIESSDEQEIQLARELELSQRYLAIEQRRFGERLQVEQNIDADLLTARVPTLILQPLLENAIRHGIESRSDQGKLAIKVQHEGERIKLSVSDNGKKPVEPEPVSLSSGRRHIGLANVRARLEQLYGREQSLTIRQGELGGWSVEILLPFRPEAKESK